MILLLLQKLLIYGCLGVLIEFFFTGIGSLFKKDLNATCTSYLWMLPVYGLAALAMEGINGAVHAPFYLKAFLYLPVIYGSEALSGWLLLKLIGTIPWDYKHGPWTPMGLINLKYAPFWLGLAMAFEPITDFLTKLLKALSVVAT